MDKDKILSDCPPTERDSTDHSILIVGYGSEDGVDYWLFKNSWGKEWLDGGFGKIRRGTGECGIGYHCYAAQCRSTRDYDILDEYEQY